MHFFQRTELWENRMYVNALATRSRERAQTAPSTQSSAINIFDLPVGTLPTSSWGSLVLGKILTPQKAGNLFERESALQKFLKTETIETSSSLLGIFNI